MPDEPRLLAAAPWVMHRPITVAGGDTTVQRIGRDGIWEPELPPVVRIQAYVLFR